MRLRITALVGLALALAGCGGPVAGEDPKAAAHEPSAAKQEPTVAARRTLRVRVVAWRTTDGKRAKAPVAGATVVVRPRDGVVDLATGQTGADGVVVLEVVRQERGYSLQASAAGLGMQSRQLDAEWPDTHGYPVEIEIEPAAGPSIVGHVLDASTGRPIAAARVFKNDVNPGRGRPLAQATTGADGSFLLPMTPP